MIRREAVIVLVGVTLGLAAAAIAGPRLPHLLYGVSARAPLTLVAGPSTLAPVSLLAMWLSVRRAMAMDPVVALRAN